MQRVAQTSGNLLAQCVAEIQWMPAMAVRFSKILPQSLKRDKKFYKRKILLKEKLYNLTMILLLLQDFSHLISIYLPLK